MSLGASLYNMVGVFDLSARMHLADPGEKSHSGWPCAFENVTQSDLRRTALRRPSSISNAKAVIDVGVCDLHDFNIKATIPILRKKHSLSHAGIGRLPLCMTIAYPLPHRSRHTFHGNVKAWPSRWSLPDIRPSTILLHLRSSGGHTIVVDFSFKTLPRRLLFNQKVLQLNKKKLSSYWQFD